MLIINFLLLKNSFIPLIQGAYTSLIITFFSLLIGIFCGTILSILLFSKNTVLMLIIKAYILLIRGTPMLIQIMALYFILPHFGIVLSAQTSAIISIGMNSAAYISQIMKAGINSVRKGQIEAAHTLGFSSWQTIRFIILPQAFKTVLPALNNECITLIKDSSLASVIGVAELTHQGTMIMNYSYDAITAYAGITIIYLCMTTIMSCFLHIIERKTYYVKH